MLTWQWIKGSCWLKRSNLKISVKIFISLYNEYTLIFLKWKKDKNLCVCLQKKSLCSQTSFNWGWERPLKTSTFTHLALLACVRLSTVKRQEKKLFVLHGFRDRVRAMLFVPESQPGLCKTRILALKNYNAKLFKSYVLLKVKQQRMTTALTARRFSKIQI